MRPLRQAEVNVLNALQHELGFRTMLHVQFRPRDMRWWRGLWT